jgi:hypothetical protein
MVTVSDFNKGKAGGNVGARRRSKPTGSPGYTPPSVRREQSKKRGTYKAPPSGGKITETRGSGAPTSTSTSTKTNTQLEQKNKEAEKKAGMTAQEVVDWWAKNGQGYRSYGDRKDLFGGGVRNTKDKVADKIADRLAKGNYKIEYTTLKMADGTVKEVPLIVHSSGITVNPYTGGIINTGGASAQGGGYQTETAKALGISQDNAGVFTREYQRGAGIAIADMKPEHALRALMKQRPQAFQDFFTLAKQKKDFNPFSISAIGTFGNILMSQIRGDIGLVVGNNLKRNGWGEAIQNDDGTYSIRLTEKGAKNWSETFKVPDYVTPEAVLKDQEKGFVGEILGTKKFAEVPVDLRNIIDVGGTVAPIQNPLLDPTDPMSPNFNPTLGDPNILQPQPQTGVIPYNFATATQGPPGPDRTPQFTPDGFRISGFNPTVNYGEAGTQRQQGQGGQGGGGGGSGGGTTNQGNLTYNVFGLPINYDYTGGPERRMIGGGFMRDGQYIGPFNFKNGGIANFRGYGY